MAIHTYMHFYKRREHGGEKGKAEGEKRNRTLCVKRGLACLVLRHLVKGVLLALRACAEGLTRLRDVHHL